MPRSRLRLTFLLVAALTCAPAIAEEKAGVKGSLDAADVDKGLNLEVQEDDWHDDDWSYALRLNGWLPNVTGTVGVQGVVTDVDWPISTVLDHLNMTFQTSFAARKGRWGFVADLFYVKLSGGTAKEKTTLISDLGLDIKEAFGQGTVFYRAKGWDGGRGFLDVGAGARIFGIDMSLDIGRDDAGVDAFSTQFASTAVDTAAGYIDDRLEPLIEQELGPRLEQAAREQIGLRLEMLADEVRQNLGNAIRNQVLGEVGTRLANRLTGRGPIGDAIDQLIEKTAQERLAEAERSIAEAEQVVTDAGEDATEAEKQLKARAAAEKQALAEEAAAVRQQAEVALANKIDQEITSKWEDEVSGSHSWVDPLIAVRMRHWLNERVFLNLYGDIGGFGVGSDFTWAAAGGLGYQATENLALELYYRAYSVDYEDDGFLYDTTLHGVFAGLAFYF